MTMQYPVEFVTLISPHMIVVESHENASGVRIFREIGIYGLVPAFKLRDKYGQDHIDTSSTWDTDAIIVLTKILTENKGHLYFKPKLMHPRDTYLGGKFLLFGELIINSTTPTTISERLIELGLAKTHEEMFFKNLNASTVELNLSSALIDEIRKAVEHYSNQNTVDHYKAQNTVDQVQYEVIEEEIVQDDLEDWVTVDHYESQNTVEQDQSEVTGYENQNTVDQDQSEVIGYENQNTVDQDQSEVIGFENQNTVDQDQYEIIGYKNQNTVDQDQSEVIGYKNQNTVDQDQYEVIEEEIVQDDPEVWVLSKDEQNEWISQVKQAELNNAMAEKTNISSQDTTCGSSYNHEDDSQKSQEVLSPEQSLYPHNISDITEEFNKLRLHSTN